MLEKPEQPNKLKYNQFYNCGSFKLKDQNSPS